MVGKFGKCFFLGGGGGWLDLSKALLSGIQKNLKIRGSAHVSRPHTFRDDIN